MKTIRKILLAVVTLATLVVAFWLYWKNRGTMVVDVPLPSPLATPGAIEDYNKAVEERKKELATASAEEVMKKWKERFGGKQG